MVFMKETRVMESWLKYNLPDELWSEILSRLPVKSLIRCRCVSKPWRLMIDAPNFCRLHLNNFENNCLETDLFVAQNDYGVSKEDYIVRNGDTFKPAFMCASFDSARLGGEWYIVSSMDGIVMLRFFDTLMAELLLWNPSIRKARILPPSPTISEGMKNVDLGFGFSSLVNDYKLVRLVKHGENSLHSVAVYTFGTGLWKTIKFHCKGISDWCWHFEFSKWSTVCFRGHLYFKANRDPDDIDFCEIVSFDLSNGIFAFTNAPIAYDTFRSQFIFNAVTLVHGGSSLGLVYLSPYEGSIWVSQGNTADIDSMQWIKCHIFISCVPHFDVPDCICSTPNFLYLGKNADVLIQWESNWVTSCNLVTWEEMTLLRKHRLNITMVCGYIESLLLLNG